MTKIKESQIIERWTALIDDAQGKGKEVFRKTAEALKEINPPRVNLFSREVVPTILKRLQGKQRTFLVVSNDYLKGYEMYIGAMNYGKQLFLSWYLVERPGILERLIQLLDIHWFLNYVLFFIYFPLRFLQRLGGRGRSAAALDLFDAEELAAYVTTVHHAFMDIAEEIAKDVDYDFTKVDRKSKGFLNIS